jgi:hypothetical protein
MENLLKTVKRKKSPVMMHINPLQHKYKKKFILAQHYSMFADIRFLKGQSPAIGEAC